MSKINLKSLLKTTNKASLFTFTVIFILTFIAFINTCIIGDFVKIGLAFAALVLYEVPILVKIFFKIDLPVTFEITYYLFIFASLILGEVFAFYGPFPFWDVILHLLSGFVLAGVGLSLVEIINKHKLPTVFTIIFAFCFSVTVGIFWECLEFGFDMSVRTDAQKDAHVHQISTITMQRDGGNQPVKLNDIVKTDIHLANGEIIAVDEGYLDIGLMDTMKDIFVNIAGAGLFCIFGATYLGRKTSLASQFIPKQIKTTT